MIYLNYFERIKEFVLDLNKCGVVHLMILIILMIVRL